MTDTSARTFSILLDPWGKKQGPHGVRDIARTSLSFPLANLPSPHEAGGHYQKENQPEPLEKWLL